MTALEIGLGLGEEAVVGEIAVAAAVAVVAVLSFLQASM
jgi:hypothetical protein